MAQVVAVLEVLVVVAKVVLVGAERVVADQVEVVVQVVGLAWALSGRHPVPGQLRQAGWTHAGSRPTSFHDAFASGVRCATRRKWTGSKVLTWGLVSTDPERATAARVIQDAPTTGRMIQSD